LSSAARRTPAKRREKRHRRTNKIWTAQMHHMLGNGASLQRRAILNEIIILGLTSQENETF
jgi:hypothetical protein